DNTVQAIVQSGAHIDAKGTVTVSSDLSYPLMLGAIPFYDFDIQEDNIIEEVGKLLNGSLGMTGVFNMWSATKGRAPDAQLTITASVGITDYLNRSEAIIENGAWINQDDDYDSDDQSVAVNAMTTMKLINMAGVIHLSLNEAGIRDFFKARQSGGFNSPFSLFGNEAGMLGIGGSVLVQNIENHTIARIGNADIRTGASGGLSVIAEEDLFSFDFVQTGGNSGKIGVSGSFSFADQTSETLAQIESGAAVSGGVLTVKAGSDAKHLNYTGAVQLARQVGVGVSAGSTTMQRDTEALIGNRLTDDDASIGNAGTIIDAADISIDAANSGLILGIGVAGAVVSDVPGLTIKDNSGDPPPQIGAGIAGVVSFAGVDDLTRAYINDNGSVSAGGELSLAATDSTDILSIAGAAAFAKTSKTAIGIAGAFAHNELNMDAEAFIAGANVVENADGVTLTADRSGDILAVAVGVAIAAASPKGAPGGVSAAVSGSASVNKIFGTTRTRLSGVDVSTTGDLILEATDDSAIQAVSIGGAGAGGQSSAVALTGAFSFNSIDNTIESIIENSRRSDGRGDGIDAGGEIHLTATDNAAIRADAGGLAIAISAKKGGGGGTGTVAVGAGAAVNEIVKDEDHGHAVRALIENSDVTADGDLTLTAVSNAQIETLAIGGAGAGQGGAGGGGSLTLAGAGAGVGNAISVDIEASILEKSVVSAAAGGDITLKAEDASHIYADAGGASLALKLGAGSGGSLTASVGIAAVVNEIDNTVLATIDDSDATADGDIKLDASATAEENQSLDFGTGDVSGSVITLDDHGLETGDRVVYVNSGDNPKEIGGLEDGRTYFVVKIDADHIKLAADKAGSKGDAPDTITLSTINAAGTHRFVTFNDKIDVFALGIAAAGSVGGGGGMSGVLAGAGSGLSNTISNTIEASITGADSDDHQKVKAVNGGIQLLAVDHSLITADAGGVAIAVKAGGGGGNSASLAFGASVALNDIDNTVSALVDDSVIEAQTDITLLAQSHAVIDALTLAGA
ncbi:MAG: hypothetical protein ACP5I1_10680, partial [Candidatus Hinthialibacter sp.]